MPKLLEMMHQYRGYHTNDGVCRIEVYTSPGLPPLLVATELLENSSTSVTNMAEYLAAEAWERWLTADLTDGHDPPFVWVERYERPRDLSESARRRIYGRDGGYEDYDLVTFSHYQRTLRGAGRRWRYRLGEPHWRPLSLAEFHALLAPYLDT
jgi:hypothetical protein